MPDMTARFYVTSVSSTTVVLSPEPTYTPQVPAGDGIQQITITTKETTADSSFWGATGQCGRFLVTVEKMS